jgi:argininosuccinate lyase
LNRERVAELLGFDGLALHTRDAMWQADIPIETMSAATAALVNADRLSEDLQIWATSEFNFVSLADRHSRTSVIMPQKKNPYSLAFVRGAAREMIGRGASVAAMQCTPSGQVDNRMFTYGSVPRGLVLTVQALNLLAVTVQGLTIHKEIMAERAVQGLTGATDLAEFIMMDSAIDSHTAHRIVGRAFRKASVRGEELSPDILDDAAREIAGRPVNVRSLDEIIRPGSVLATRACPGGAGREAVQEMLALFRRITSEHESWSNERRTGFQLIEQKLVEEARMRAATGSIDGH